MEHSERNHGLALRSLLGGILLTAAGLLLVLGLTGCDDDDIVDVTPPAVPAGVYSITADQEIFLRWIPNSEPDLAGYHVLSNSDGGNEYFIIDTIDWDEWYFDMGTDDPGDDIIEYHDAPLDNGEEYYYAVVAFDEAGNESALSFETVRDVPRPEGDVLLTDAQVNASLSGYDFSGLTSQPQHRGDLSTDVWLESDLAGVLFLRADVDRVRVQDYGNVGFDVATWAPADGWSRLGMVEAIEGHTYIFEIYDGAGRTGALHYAKLTVYSIAGGVADTRWGWQAVAGEPELKRPGVATPTPTLENEEG